MALLVALGVDWSGGSRAGRKIWAARIEHRARRHPELVSLEQPFVMQPTPAEVVDAFAPWLTAQHAEVVGLDFCFSLSHQQLIELDLLESALGGPRALGSAIEQRFATALDFRAAAGPEKKRAADDAVRTPFAATNLRMFRQTYVGLRALGRLSPHFRFPPWDPWAEGTTMVLEILPAQLARALGVPRYKGPRASSLRRRLLEQVQERTALSVPHHLGRLMVADEEGDALDAVLAALIAHGLAVAGLSPVPAPVIASGEGWIYEWVP